MIKPLKAAEEWTNSGLKYLNVSESLNELSACVYRWICDTVLYRTYSELQMCAADVNVETHLDYISLPEAQLVLCCGGEVIFPCRLHDGDTSETRTRNNA